jgi:hypothetical protein
MASLAFATYLAGSICTDCVGRDRFMAVYCIMGGVCVIGYLLCIALVYYQKREERLWLEEQAMLAERKSSAGGSFDVYGAIGK